MSKERVQFLGNRTTFVVDNEYVFSLPQGLMKLLVGMTMALHKDCRPMLVKALQKWDEAMHLDAIEALADYLITTCDEHEKEHKDDKNDNVPAA